MFVTIQPHEQADNTALIEQYYRLRKRVFYDDLQWDVPVEGDRERDAYDDLKPTYLVWCSDDRTTLYGAVRLLPTTGPTLLHDVFHETHGSNAILIAPDTWEVTRMCIDTAKIAIDFAGVTPARAISFILLALCECGLAHGIARMVSNFEACIQRMYRKAGLAPNIYGSAHSYGRKQVYCASFDITEDLLLSIRKAIGVHVPIHHRTNAFNPLVQADDRIAA